MPIADIEDRLVKAIAERGLTLPEVYDLICTSDESADRDSFVAQTVMDWDFGEEWVAPIVEVVRDSDMTFEELRQKFLPALVAEARVDAEAAQSAREAQIAAEATARRIARISRLLAAAVTFMSLWLPISEGWAFAFPAGIGALVLSFILPSRMTAENIAWPALGTFLGILVVGYGGGLWSFATKLLVFFGIVALGMILSRLLESGVPAAKIPQREPGEMARAASAQVT